MRYVKLLSLILAIPALCLAAPQGFDGASEGVQAGAPKGFNQNLLLNTAEGIRSNAQDGDYVVLQGTIGQSLSLLKYEFYDVQGDSIIINLPENAPVLPTGLNCQIWARIDQSLFDTQLEVIHLAPLH